MKVDVKVNERTYVGTVVMTPSNAPRDADEKTKSSILIKLNKLPKGVTSGYMADITLLQVKKDNVIVISKDAINTVGSRKFVNILKNGQKIPKDIQTGAENDTEVVVLKGLSEGDQVIQD
jgi:hypothetical protein